MRLSPEDIAAIRQSAHAAFGASATIRLFGSRVHDHLRGGDIDLHVEVDPGHGTDAELDRFEDLLFRELEPQRVDTVFTVRGDPIGPFEQIAYRDGIVL